MMKISIQRLRNQALALLPVVALCFGFLLAGSVTASAQDYVTAEQAELILKPEINTLYANLTILTPGTSEYKQQYATMNYYTTLVSVLHQGQDVAAAIEAARPGICYPTPKTDCTASTPVDAQIIVESTMVLLSN